MLMTTIVALSASSVEAQQKGGPLGTPPASFFRSAAEALSRAPVATNAASRVGLSASTSSDTLS